MKRCNRCHGDGKDPYYVSICRDCGGSGTIPDKSVTCPKCNGDGRDRFSISHCKNCGGTGKIVIRI
jgi:DnaJ-class molecular chaperone